MLEVHMFLNLVIIIMSSNIVLTNSDEIYILTLHRTFKIKILHLINDLNDRLDNVITTRTKDITNIVNATFNTRNNQSFKKW